MATRYRSSFRFNRPSPIIRSALSTVAVGIQGLEALAERLGEEDFAARFEEMVTTIYAAKGRAIFTGMGKSGIVARKTSATLTSTGTPAMFLHPAEAGHGDMGMITEDDVVVMVTRSGETAELTPIMSYCKRFGIPLIAVTARVHSTVGEAADLTVPLPAVREACPNALSPTSSTTLQMVFGDALAMALVERRGFSADDFHKFHPSGKLGAQLVKVCDLMAVGDMIPSVPADASLLDATVEMTRARFGGTAIVDADQRLLGGFTDGDLRRTLSSGGSMDQGVAGWMTRDPLRIDPNDFASEALRLMQNRSVTLMFVVEHDRLVGVIHMHDALAVGIA